MDRERADVALRVFISVKVVVLIVLAGNSRFVMDEFWTITQSVYLFDGTFDTIWPAKAVGYALFYEIAHAIGWDATSILIAGRLSTAILALLLVWVVYQTARALGQDRITALLAIALLLSMSSFMERSFRLRSEPLAVLFSATALLVIIRGGADRMRTVLLAGLLCGFAFVTTQKAVYFNVALGTGLVIDALLARKFFSALRRGGLLIIGWAAALMIYAVGLGGTAAPEVLRVLFLGPLELALEGGSYYERLSRYLWQTFSRNVLIYGLIVLGLLYAVVAVVREGGGRRIALINALVVGTLVYTHNQPWPYTFATAVPFLVIYAAFAVRVLADRRIGAVLASMIILAITAQSFIRNVYYFQHDNSVQLALVRDAESMLDPGGTYFDGIGMVPSRRMEPRIWLDFERLRAVLAEGEASQVMQAIRAQAPSLIIETYRTDVLAPLIKEELETNYPLAAPYIRIPRRLQEGRDIVNSRKFLFKGVYSF